MVSAEEILTGILAEKLMLIWKRVPRSWCSVDTFYVMGKAGSVVNNRGR